jgi:hypothetical protein
MALVEYCDAEPTALIEANRDIAEALVSALIEAGTQGGDEVGEILASPSHGAVGGSRTPAWRKANAATFQGDAWREVVPSGSRCLIYVNCRAEELAAWLRLSPNE